MAPFDSDYLSEIHEVMNGFKILLQGSPSKALVGQQFDLRVKKALLGQDGKEKALVQKVKQLEVAVMELQEGIIAREKAEQEAALKVKAEKERAEKEAAVKVKPEKKKVEKEAALKVMPEKKMRVEEDRAANSREFSERIGDEGDESYNEYWARKERAAFKRKLVERNDGDDEVWASKKRSAFRRKFAETETVNDEERLTKVFNEVQWMVKQNPGCTGKTPIGTAFDEIRNLMGCQPSRRQDNTAFLVEIKHLASNLVDEFIKIDGGKGLGGSFRRIRNLLL